MEDRFQEHYWDKKLGIFIPAGEDHSDASEGSPSESMAKRRKMGEERAREIERLRQEREARYEEWRREVRSELAQADGDSGQLERIRSKYSLSPSESGQHAATYENSPPEIAPGIPGAGGFVYVIQDNSTGLYKIGRTLNLERRKKELGVGKTARLISSKWVYDAASTERRMHSRYKASRLPQSEYFKLASPPLIH